MDDEGILKAALKKLPRRAKRASQAVEKALGKTQTH
jgi:hypothetical protein